MQHRDSRSTVLGPIVLTTGLLLVLMPGLVHSRDWSWFELREPGLSIGAEKEETVKLVADEVRAMRTLLEEVLIKQARPDVHIAALRNEDDLRAILPQGWERTRSHHEAVYWKGPYDHRIAVRTNVPTAVMGHMVRHEYLHALVIEQLPDAPLWLREGVAEFWAAALEEPDAVMVGRPLMNYVSVLQDRRAWISFDDLLAREALSGGNDHETVMFYAESWALVHYLMMANTPTAQTWPLFPQGYDTLDAGILEDKMTSYVRTAHFRGVRVPSAKAAVAETGGDIRPVSERDALVTRAGFLLDGGRGDDAFEVLQEVLRREPDHPMALEWLGRYYFQENEPEAAAKRFDQAIATGRASYLSPYYRAILAGPVPGAATSEELLRRALELNPCFLEARRRLVALGSDSGQAVQ